MQNSRLDLIEAVLHPGAFELCDAIAEDVQELVEQLTKQADRLKELREKKKTDPGSYLLFPFPSHLLMYPPQTRSMGSTSLRTSRTWMP